MTCQMCDSGWMTYSYVKHENVEFALCHVATRHGIRFTILRLSKPCEHRIRCDVELEVTLLCKLWYLWGNCTLQLLMRRVRVMGMNTQFPPENNISGVPLFHTHVHVCLLFPLAVAALSEFRAALDPGGQLTSWTPSNSCERWEGLTCDSNRFVTQMWVYDSESGCQGRGYVCM